GIASITNAQIPANPLAPIGSSRRRAGRRPPAHSYRRSWSRRARSRRRVDRAVVASGNAGAGAGLAHRPRCDDRAVTEARQVAPLLHLGAEADKRDLERRHLSVEGEDEPVVLAGVAKRLEGERDRKRI